MGVGEDLNEDLLIGIAEASGGNFYFIEEADRIPAYFAREFQGLLSVLAQSLRVTVTGGPGVAVERVLGYETQPVPGGVAVTLPDLYEHEEKVLLAELRLPPLEAGQAEAGRVVCEYLAVDGGLAAVSTEATVALRAETGGDFAADLDVMKQVRLFQAAVARDQAVEAADRGDTAAASRLLREHIALFDTLASELPSDPDLLREKEVLASKLSELEQTGELCLLSRKQMRWGSYAIRRRGA